MRFLLPLVMLVLMVAAAALTGCSDGNTLVPPMFTVKSDISVDFGVESPDFFIENNQSVTATGVRVRLEVKEGDDILTITSNNFQTASYPVTTTKQFRPDAVYMQRNEGQSWNVVGLTSDEGYLIGAIAPGENITLILNYGP